jgi:hypothetical protein
MQELLRPAEHTLLSVGTSVEVRDRFCAAWARGFEVAAVTRQGYELRRRSDGQVLPVEFALDDVRCSRVDRTG